MIGNLPPVFRVTLRDTSLAPELLPGDVLVIDCSLKPQPKDWVIVRDAAGQLYARQYRERTPGVWSAHALNEAFEPMRADQEPGLEVVGVSTEQRLRRRRSAA